MKRGPALAAAVQQAQNVADPAVVNIHVVGASATPSAKENTFETWLRTLSIFDTVTHVDDAAPAVETSDLTIVLSTAATAATEYALATYAPTLHMRWGDWVATGIAESVGSGINTSQYSKVISLTDPIPTTAVTALTEPEALLFYSNETSSNLGYADQMNSNSEHGVSALWRTNTGRFSSFAFNAGARNGADTGDCVNKLACLAWYIDDLPNLSAAGKQYFQDVCEWLLA